MPPRRLSRTLHWNEAFPNTPPLQYFITPTPALAPASPGIYCGGRNIKLSNADNINIAPKIANERP